MEYAQVGNGMAYILSLPLRVSGYTGIVYLHVLQEQKLLVYLYQSVEGLSGWFAKCK